ncbi:MAG: hypothetical protein Greene041614_844 [Parcubacteria group bacterium Greene0416_14]|nr:MAG: hypothetical protein Greene041614_844 [Parcubacteria group bacterium Greene0416_14]TSD08083.1 MAG: hypothetical protein Greene07144_433 [Parcubacteria group bacterium Greene0714_4]
MGMIDRTLLAAIDKAPDSAAETAIILRLSEPCDDRQRSEIELCGVKIDTVSVRIVTGSISIGKIRKLNHLPYILSIKAPIEHHLANKA